MSDKKVKIANILGSQIPDFIQADNPLFKEFLTQYYESEEHEYGTTYLAEHISSLKKIPTVSDISLVEKVHELGCRFMQLTYNNQSLLATGCYEKVDSGVTNFGREVIKEMNLSLIHI